MSSLFYAYFFWLFHNFSMWFRLAVKTKHGWIKCGSLPGATEPFPVFFFFFFGRIVFSLFHERREGYQCIQMDASSSEHKALVMLITGGCGFIGSNLCHYMIERYPTLRVICYDLLTYAANPASLAGLPADRFRLVVGDVRDEKLLRKVLVEEKVDTVVHLAAESHVDRSIDDPGVFLTTNVNGTFCVLQAARAAWRDGFEGKRFHYVSTDEVFGALGPSDPLSNESSRYNPRNPYSASKAAADHLVRAWANTFQLPITISNCSNNYGPRQFPEKLIPLMVVRALRGDRLPIYGDGMQIRDWLYVDDHCSAIDVIIRRGKIGESYNVGAINEQHNLDIVRKICKILDEIHPAKDGQPYARLIQHIEDRPGHDRRYAIDSSKLMKELGWKPVYSFDQALLSTIQWYLRNQPWVESILSGSYNTERLGLTLSYHPSD